MDNETTVETLPTTTEQSDAGMAGSMSQAEYAAAQVKKAMAAKSQATQKPAQEAETKEAQAGETDESAEVDAQASKAEADGDKSKDTEQSEEQPEAEDGDVPFKLDPKLQKQFDKRVGKLTARAKTAEEEVVRLKEQLAQKPEAEQPAVVTSDNPSDRTSTAFSDEDLGKIERDARNTVDFIEANERAITRAIARDEDTVIIGGREFNVDELRNFGKEAEKHLNRYIPQRRQFIQTRSNAVSEAKAIMPELFDRASAEYQEFTAFKRKNPGIQSMPDGELLYAQAIIGRKTLKESKEKKATATKAAAVPPKAGSVDAPATAKPRTGNANGEKAKLTVELGQAEKAMQGNPSQANYQRVLILKDRLKKLN